MCHRERNRGYVRTSEWALFVFPDLTVSAFSSLLLDMRPSSNGGGDGRGQKNGWAWTELPAFWFLCLKAEDQEYSRIFWEECKRTKSAKSLQWKRLQEQRGVVRAMGSIQGGHVLAPPHPQPSFTRAQSQSTAPENNWKFEDSIFPYSHCYRVIQTILLKKYLFSCLWWVLLVACGI